MVKEFRFRYRNASVPSVNTHFNVTTNFIDFNGPQSGTELCDHVEAVPPIPDMSPDLLKVLDDIQKLRKDSLPKRHRRKQVKVRAPKVSKMNGFTAYKSYYSRNLTSVSQGVLSSALSKVWATEKNQYIWDLYANVFRRYKRCESFPEWLDKTSSTSQSNVNSPVSSTSNSPDCSPEPKYTINEEEIPIINFSDSPFYNVENFVPVYSFAQQYPSPTPSPSYYSFQYHPVVDTSYLLEPTFSLDDTLTFDQHAFLVGADLSTLIETSEILDTLNGTELITDITA